MTHSKQSISLPLHQRGTALVVGMVLLMVITLLAISSMNTSTLELQMAGNMQYSRKAIGAAEAGVEAAIRQPIFDSTTNNPISVTPLSTDTGETDRHSSTTVYAGATPCVEGCSLGSGAVGTRSHHFVITSTGTSARNAQTVVRQGFFIPGP